MIEIALNSIEKFYGATKVLENITFEIQTGDRTGIIGRNGTGKTTIFKIISGHEKYDNGTLTIRKGAAVGYLDQIPVYDDSYKVIDVLHTVFTDVLNMESEMKELEGTMSSASGSDLEKIMRKYGELQHKYEVLGGYEVNERISKICTGLKFSDEFKGRYFNTLSGGEKTTVVLAKILLQSPDILLLDEPTNHLDMDSIEWLEEYLKEYKGTVLMISHDRYFLDRVVNKIIEIEDMESIAYNGNYSFYTADKERRLLEQYEDFKDQQKTIKNLEKAIIMYKEWGNRGDNPKFHRKAASLQKKLDKMQKIEKPVFERTKIQLNFSGSERSGKDVIKVSGLSKAFDNNIILKDLDLHIRFGDKTALLGRNGSGKSTLLKIILGLYSPDSGDVEVGGSVKIGYLEQDIRFDREEMSILDYFRDRFPMLEGPARFTLAKFLFYGEAVFKKVGSLSGGEKSRLRLCELMQQDINLLILDEPTNHLDIDSREMLEEALSEFQGTILFISHDRYFINKLASRIIELRDRRLVNYEGNYDYYREKKLEQKPDRTQKTVIPIAEKQPDTRQKPLKKKNEYKISLLESRIKEIEEKLEQVSADMDTYASDYTKLNELLDKRPSLQKELDSLMEQWLELNE